jgi:hypothetical protein
VDPARDTTVEVEDLQTGRLQAMAADQKLSLVIAMSQAVRELAIAGIRQRHPGASDREVVMRLAVVQYGPDLATAAYPELAGLDIR